MNMLIGQERRAAKSTENKKALCADGVKLPSQRDHYDRNPLNSSHSVWNKVKNSVDVEAVLFHFRFWGSAGDSIVVTETHHVVFFPL